MRDGDAIRALFRDGICEHITPTFTNAMFSPLYLGITLALCTACYLQGGGVLAACLFVAWVGLVYYCSHALYADYVNGRLQADMLDIQKSYLSNPDNSFFVAETEVEGRTQYMGMVAVAGQTDPGSGERYGELFRMIVSSTSRRTGLGTRLAQTAIDFCKERGFSKVVLETSSTQMAAVALYEKLGFRLTRTHTTTASPEWVRAVTRVIILRMEMDL